MNVLNDLRRISSRAKGFAWLTCARCGRRYGSQEKGAGRLLGSPVVGESTCPRCPGTYERFFLPNGAVVIRKIAPKGQA